MVSNFDYKSLTKDELKYIFREIKFKKELMNHQLISMVFGIDKKRIALFLDVGTGKTATALGTSLLWKCKKILVICPSSAFSAWEKDISQFTDYTSTFLIGNGRDRRALLKKKKDIYIINYEGLKTIYGHLVKGKGWKVDVSNFVDKFDCIILDEAHKCKNYDTIQSEICYELSSRSEHCIGLTGTPIDRSMLELFNIYKVIDLGKSLGNNYFYYRRSYFQKGYYEWYIKPECKERILEKLSGVTISFDRAECFDLPDLQEIVKWINPSEEFLNLQHSIIKGETVKVSEGVLNGSSQDTPLVIKSKGDKLRQLASGFVYYENGTGRKAHLLKKNPKIEALLDILEDSGGKVIIFYHYVEEGNILKDVLKKNKILFVEVNGSIIGEERNTNIKKFMTDENIRILLSQSSCGSEGFDAYLANTVIFFSPVASPKIRKQCIGRMQRLGKVGKSLVIDLVLLNSIEEKILKNRDERTSLVKTVMDYIQSYLKKVEIV
jgi:SWI/SNF-related matrix-associated actin-dependent regulator 1 of chromatin subfamily A